MAHFQTAAEGKRLRGAFWEDSYHATAVDTEAYLARCMAYIDLKMVRAGVVDHPRLPLAGVGLPGDPGRAAEVPDHRSPRPQ